MAEPALTSYDHLLASAVTALVTQRVYNKDRETMWLKILEDTLPHVTRDHPMVAMMATTAERLVDYRDGNLRCRVHVDASDAIVRWSEWRIGRAQDVIQKAKVAA